MKIAYSYWNLPVICPLSRYKLTLEWKALADDLAKAATIDSSMTNRTVKISKGFLSTKISDVLKDAWRLEWTENPVEAYTKKKFPQPKDALPLHNSFVYHYYTQIITGHAVLNGYLHKIGLVESSKCKCGADNNKHHPIYLPLV